MAGLFDFLGANQGTGMYDDLLTPEQRQRIQQQSMMNLGATLLAASGKSTEPVNVGQALGTAMLSSQKARTDAEQNALQGMLNKQKIQQYQKGLKTSDMINQALLGQGVPTTPQGALTAPVAVAGPVGPTAQRAAMIGQPSAPQQTGGFDLSVLTPIQKMAIAGITDPDKKVKALMDATAGASEYGAPVNAMVDGKPVMVRYNKFGQQMIVQGATPYQATPADIQGYQFAKDQGYKGSFLDWKQAVKAGTNVSVNTGPSGFKNEMDLKSSFKSEPIYKDYQDMRSAYSQIQASLKQETPIADTAAATKIMKLLDPGSVVRESELGMAMAATGRMDRLQNYVSNWLSGQRLTPSQRIEFGNLANELMAASAQAYNMKRGEYETLGSGYGLNANRALGPMVQVPSIMKQEQPKTNDEDRKKNLKNLLGL